MKKMNKLMAVATALVLACSLSTVAFAASETASDAVPVVTGANSGKDVVVANGTASAAAEEDVKEAASVAKKFVPADAQDVRIERAFDITSTDKGGEVTVKLATNGRSFVVLHKVGGTWKTETVTNCAVDLVTFKTGSFSPFALVSYIDPGLHIGEPEDPATPAGANTTTPAAPAAGSVPTSPKTGVEFPMASIVAVAALAGAAFCAKKFSVKE